MQGEPDVTAVAFGTLTLVRGLGRDTVLAHVALHADLGQFADPERVATDADHAGLSGRDGEEILVGDATFALTFTEAMEARDISGPDVTREILERFDDRVSFDVRVPGILGAALPYMSRLPDEIGRERIGAVAMVESLSAAPGFDRYDILEAALGQLAPMTIMSALSLFWIHSEIDHVSGSGALHAEMARQAAFRRRSRLRATTFPRLGTIPATLAGLLPAGQGLSGQHATIRIPTELDIALYEDPLPISEEET